MTFYVYILHSKKSGRYYIGQTNNLEDRLRRHNAGYVKSTKAFRPWELVYTEVFHTRRDSVKRENYLKRLKSKKAIKVLIYSHQ